MLTPANYWVGKHNSDIYTYELLKSGLEKARPLDMLVSDSRLLILQANASYAFAAALWRSKLPNVSQAMTKLWHFSRRAVWLPPSVIERAQADIVYSILLFPVNRLPVPIVLETDFNHWGIPALRTEIDRLRYNPPWIVERSAVILVRHQASLDALKEQYPDQAHKGILTPSMLPGCEAITEEQLTAKFAAFARPVIKVLFVGNAAREKGVRQLVQAYQALKERYPLELTVVSRFSDGPVTFPPDVRVLSNLPPAEVYRLMRKAHIFAMPATRDSHGRVFWEAMAAGCALLAPCFTPHQELFGEFGLTADPTSLPDVVRALQGLVENPGLCSERALSARKAFIQKFHHSVAINTYYEAFRRAAAQPRPAGFHGR